MAGGLPVKSSCSGADWVGLGGQLYLVYFHRVRWFGGLTSLRALALSRARESIDGGAGSRAPFFAFILTLDAAPPSGKLGRGTKGDVLYRASFLGRLLALVGVRLRASRGFVVAG